MLKFRCLIFLFARYAATHVDAPWIIGSGWIDQWFDTNSSAALPLALLDKIVSDRPTAFRRFDVHAVWVNSKALEAVGISATTIISGGVVELSRYFCVLLLI